MSELRQMTIRSLIAGLVGSRVEPEDVYKASVFLKPAELVDAQANAALIAAYLQSFINATNCEAIRWAKDELNRHQGEL